jgi:hypothetical protein
LKIKFNIILPSTPRSSKWAHALTLLHQTPVCTSLILIRAACPAQLSLDLVIPVIMRRRYS